MENKTIKIVFATGNPHKLHEINEISKGSGIEFVLPPDNFDPDETGLTFEENSYIKAKEAARLSGSISLADDSGLCVDALNGEPGQDPAKFVCAMTLVDESGNILDKEIGECHGQIAQKQSGVNGFGYDPIFLVDGYGITMADMSEELKNVVSHRSSALNKIISYIKTSLL